MANTAPLPVGTRVRHYGHQWPAAHRDGTGNIREVKGPYPDGSYEYLVDVEDGGTTPRWWSSFATIHVFPILATQAEDPHADCIQPHLGPDGEHHDCDGNPL